MGVGQSVFLCPEAFLHPVPSKSQLGLTDVLGWSSESHFLQEVFRAPSQAPSLCCALWRHLLEHDGLTPTVSSSWPSGPGLMLVSRP